MLTTTLACLLLVPFAQNQDGASAPIVLPALSLGDQPRPTLEVFIDGSVRAGSRLLWDAGHPEAKGADLERFLVNAAQLMPKERFDDFGMRVPCGTLTLRVDECAPYSIVSRILAFTLRRGVQIWALEFPINVDPETYPGDRDEGQDVLRIEALDSTLQSAWNAAQPPPILDLRVRVTEPGEKRAVGGNAPWSGAPGTRFEFSDARRLEYSFDGLVTEAYDELPIALRIRARLHPDVKVLRLTAEEGVTTGEVLRLYQVASKEHYVDLFLPPAEGED